MYNSIMSLSKLKIDDLGLLLSVKLTDCTDESNFDASSVSDQFMIITRPDNTVIKKPL